MLRNKVCELRHGIALLALWAYTTIPTYATVVHPLDVPALVENSDLVALGRVISIQEQGGVTVDMPAGPALAKGFMAALAIDHVLKGNPESQTVYFDFFVSATPSGYRNVPQGQYGIFFLQKTPHSQFRESDPFYPFLPAVPGALLSNGPPLDQVVAKLGEALTDNRSTESDISSALNALVTIPVRSATEILRHALETSSGDLQLHIASKLVARNDISGLDVVEKALLRPAESQGYLLLELAGSLGGLKDPKSVPALKPLIETNNPYIVKGAAIALRQSGSVDALEPLSHLLSDTDEQVRYYAVVGMGEITKQDQWTPTFEEFRGREGYYLSYWRDWAVSNVSDTARK